MIVPPLQAGCPWAAWERPNAKWCEANRCAFITAPSNTWTNLAYLFVALVVAREALGLRMATVAGKNKLPSRRAGLVFAATLTLVGVTSFAFHASYTLMFQFGDFLGMFAFCALPIVLNLRRIGWLPRRFQLHAGLSVVAGGTAAMLAMALYGLMYQLIVLCMVIMILALEIAIYCRERLEGGVRKVVVVDRGNLFKALMWLLAALVCSAADMLRLWCEPHSLLQGHALWHILSATGLLHVFRFYSHNFHLDSQADELPLLLPRVM